MKKIVAILIIAGIIGSCCISISAIENPISLGTLDYRDFEYVMIDSPTEVNLTFVSSESFGSSALTVEKIDYYPTTNETKYKFTSEEVTPYFWFEPGIKEFVYQDMTTGQLYTESIDYTDVEVPLSDTEIAYNLLLSNYSDLSISFTDLETLYASLANITDRINNTLSAYVNISNFTLDDAVDNLYANFLLVENCLNDTSNDLQELKEEEKSLMEELNETTKSRDDITIHYLDMESKYAALNSSYNTTFNSMMNFSGELSDYEAFVSKLEYGTKEFYWRGSYYLPFASYQQQIEYLQGDIGMFPIYMTLVIIICLTGCYFYYKYKIKAKQINPIDMDRKFGYSKEAMEMDKFSMGKLFNKINPLKKNKPKAIKAEDNPGENKDEKYVELQNEIDSKFELLDEKIDTKISNIESSVDLLLKAQGITQ